MAILFAHEMGHYLTSRFHNVPTSMPYFIPAPPSVFIFGTFGAFIRMKALPRTRRMMFDIGAAGPWAGALLALPAGVIALWVSGRTPLHKSADGVVVCDTSPFLALSHPGLVGV